LDIITEKKAVNSTERFAFYKEYYQITNRIYADHTIWFAQDREQAWRKGQINTSKNARGVFIATQYCSLLVAGILFFTGNVGYGIIGCVMYLLSSLITDFSITKIELLYQIFTHNSPFTSLLYKAFSGTIDPFWSIIQPKIKKKVSGFVRINRNKFVAKYRVVFRKNYESVTIIISPFNIKLKSETDNIVFNDRTATLTQIANDITQVLNTL